MSWLDNLLGLTPPLNLSNPGLVTGVLARGNQQDQDIAGDATGTTGAMVVTGLQSRPVASTSPTVGDALTWSGTSWSPLAQDTTNFNVRNYGAVGDNTHDDTTAINAAISACNT